MPSARVQSVLQRFESVKVLELRSPPPVASPAEARGDEPGFPLVETARDDALAALERGETHYTDVAGIAPLREGVAAMLATLGVSAASDAVVITAGEQEARFLAIHVFAQLDWEVLLPQIVHPGVRKTTGLARTRAHAYPVDPVTMEPDLAALRRALAGGRRALYVESPHRLTGRSLPRRQVEAIAEEAQRADAVVIWDAALAPWTFGTEYRYLAAIDGMAERTLILGRLWPATGVEGWHIGYLAGPPAWMARVRSLKQVIAICTCAPAQWGALGALRSRPWVPQEVRNLLLERRTQAARLLDGYVLPGDTASVLAVRLPDRVEAGQAPGSPARGEEFGAPGVVRYTVTPATAVIEAASALARVLSASGGKP